MTTKKFYLFLFLQLVFLILVKIWLFDNEVFAVQTYQTVLFFLIVAVISAALVRRFGVISFLEALLIIAFWFVADAIFDLLITSRYTGLGLFKVWQYWAGFGIMFLSIMFFHKKRHIAIRKELRAKAHAHAAQHPKH